MTRCIPLVKSSPGSERKTHPRCARSFAQSRISNWSGRHAGEQDCVAGNFPVSDGFKRAEYLRGKIAVLQTHNSQPSRKPAFTGSLGPDIVSAGHSFDRGPAMANRVANKRW